MEIHAFIFQPGEWIGEGKVSFSASPDEIRFFTHWDILDKERSEIRCTQQVEMQGVEDKVTNNFRMYAIAPTSFAVELTNELLGTVHGTGIIDENKLAWELRGHPHFEGFEVYRLTENGIYEVHAEYASPDQFRTIIDGRVWRKQAP